MSIDDLLAIKAKSPGAKRSDSPWNDPTIGFPAMCEKSPKRRLARSLPLNVMQLAARMDEAHEEQGKTAWISPSRGVIVDGEALEHSPQPTFEEMISPGVNHASRPAGPSSSPIQPESDEEGEIVFSLEDDARAAAMSGPEAMNRFWRRITKPELEKLRPIIDELRRLVETSENKGNFNE